MEPWQVYTILGVLAVLWGVGNFFGYKMRVKMGDFNTMEKGERIFQKIWTCIFGTGYLICYGFMKLKDKIVSH